MGNTVNNDWATTGNNRALIPNAIIKVGWLIKKGATRKNWTKRYVILLKTGYLHEKISHGQDLLTQATHYIIKIS